MSIFQDIRGNHRVHLIFLVSLNIAAVLYFTLLGIGSRYHPLEHKASHLKLTRHERQVFWSEKLSKFKGICARSQSLPRSSRFFDKSCSPTRQFAFIKIHRTGSDTLSNILFRYGLNQNIVFCLPIGSDRVFNWPQLPDRRHVYIPGHRSKCEAVAHHLVYSKNFLQTVLPADTSLITLLREPFEHLRSSLSHFRESEQLQLPPHHKNPVEEFLSKPEKYERKISFPHGSVSITKNFQTQQLGFNGSETPREIIQRLEKSFSLVGITEYFTESVVLLRRKLCLPFHSILHLHLNTNTFEAAANSDILRKKVNQWSVTDHHVYQHFLQKIELEINQQPKGFKLEVQCLRQLNIILRTFCAHAHMSDRLEVPATPWADAFIYHKDDCALLTLLPFEFTKIFKEKYFTPFDRIRFYLSKFALFFA